MTHMHEVWPLGRRGNAIQLDSVPPELEQALSQLPAHARTARCGLAYLASRPGEIVSQLDLLQGIRKINPQAKRVQLGSIQQSMRDAVSGLSAQGIHLPIEKRELEDQPQNGNNHFRRMGWVWTTEPGKSE